jgi:hypothetical protein
VFFPQLITVRTRIDDLLKGQCHEIFDLWLFSSNVPLLGPRFTGSCIFAYGFKFAKLFDKVVPQRCQWHRWYRTSDVIDTAGAAPAVSLLPLMPHQWCHWHCWWRTSGVNDTAGPSSADSAVPTIGGHKFVSSFPFRNDPLERSLQTTIFCGLLGTKDRERPGVFKHEERCTRYI